jgi:glycosyltransferase involved in cell wall biosynthesis
MRIAVLCPPWIPVPPPGYGGIEAVLDLLASALVRRGHDVSLFAAPGSRSEATVINVLDAAHPDEIERAVHEADHVALALELIEAGIPDGRPYDVIHDNCGYTGVAMADRISVPLVHTLHGPIGDGEGKDFYEHHGHKVTAVALSEAQASDAPRGLEVAAVIPNPIDVAAWPFVTEKDDFLLWIGRMNASKGPQRALAVARQCGSELVLAGPIQQGQEKFFRTEIEPHLDSLRVSYVGEVGGRQKKELFARARALLMPIRWPEPFGMVMVEALATGTPVIAFREGSAPEIVEDGASGFLVADEEEMAATIERISSLEPWRCRESAERFDSGRIAALYEEVFERVAGAAGPNPAPAAPAKPEP